MYMTMMVLMMTMMVLMMMVHGVDCVDDDDNATAYVANDDDDVDNDNDDDDDDNDNNTIETMISSISQTAWLSNYLPKPILNEMKNRKSMFVCM